MNKRLGAALACAGMVIFSTSALAWGDRERAALWGVIGGAMLANAASNQEAPPVRVYAAPVVYAPPTPVYEYRTVYVPAPGYVVESARFDDSRVAAAYERGRIDRQRDRQAHLEREAYERGYQGAWGGWR